MGKGRKGRIPLEERRILSRAISCSPIRATDGSGPAFISWRLRTSVNIISMAWMQAFVWLCNQKERETREGIWDETTKANLKSDQSPSIGALAHGTPTPVTLSLPQTCRGCTRCCWRTSCARTGTPQPVASGSPTFFCPK
jgi:hypothetical protein